MRLSSPDRYREKSPLARSTMSLIIFVAIKRCLSLKGAKKPRSFGKAMSELIRRGKRERPLTFIGEEGQKKTGLSPAEEEWKTEPFLDRMDEKGRSGRKKPATRCNELNH